MNYQTLFQTIQAYCENNFPNTAVNTPNSGSNVTSVSSTNFLTKTQIDTFITQAEYRIFNTVQIPDLRKNVTGAVTPSNKYLSVPSDWLANFSLAVIEPVTGKQYFLLNKDVEYIREAFPDPNDEGMPTHYAIFDQNSYILGPTPDVAYVMELHYFYYPASIVPEPVANNLLNTTWLSTKFPQALLYGALLEAYTYMKGERDVNEVYISRYNEALAMLKQLGEGKNRQDMYRTEQARYPVR